MLVDIKVVSVHEKMGKDKAKMKLKGYTYICYTYIYISAFPVLTLWLY